MDPLVGQQNDQQNPPDDVLGAGPADSDPPPTADTLPSSSPPPAAENDDENPTVAPSSTVTPDSALDPSVAHDDNDPHTSDVNADEMLLDTVDPGTVSDAAGGQVDEGQEWVPDGQDQEMKRVKVCIGAISRPRSLISDRSTSSLDSAGSTRAPRSVSASSKRIPNTRSSLRAQNGITRTLSYRLQYEAPMSISGSKVRTSFSSLFSGPHSAQKLSLYGPSPMAPTTRSVSKIPKAVRRSGISS